MAGFNQFFGMKLAIAIPGTDAWRYGVAIDHKFSLTVYAGAEFSKRDLEVTVSGGNADSQGNPERGLGRISGARLLLLDTPPMASGQRGIPVRAALERGETFGAGTGILEADTHRLPLEVSFFHPSGFSAQIKATYIGQDGKFAPRTFIRDL